MMAENMYQKNPMMTKTELYHGKPNILAWMKKKV